MSPSKSVWLSLRQIQISYQLSYVKIVNLLRERHSLGQSNLIKIQVQNSKRLDPVTVDFKELFMR